MDALDTLRGGMRHLFAAIVCALGCSGPGNVPDRPIGTPGDPTDIQPTAPLSELSPALNQISWILGTWRGDQGSEHWIAAGGAIYGVGLANDGGFEVMIIDDGEGPGQPDGRLRFIAMPGGADSTQFELEDLAVKRVAFANPAHDFPKTIYYRLPADGHLTARVAGGDKSIGYAFRRETSPARAPELAGFDLRFSEDTANRGIDGWVAAFATDGGMLKQGKRIQGPAAIAELMGPVLASGKLAWAPIASGKRGKVGFTVGKATFTAAKPADNWKSSYVTIWRQQADGTWKVWFDTGRVVNE